MNPDKSANGGSLDERKQAFRLRTKNFAGQIVRLFCKFPRNRFEVEIVGKQLIRSGTSVAAKYWEASRAHTPANFFSKIGICNQEADKTQQEADEFALHFHYDVHQHAKIAELESSDFSFPCRAS